MTFATSLDDGTFPHEPPHPAVSPIVLVLGVSEERCNEIAWLLRISGYQVSIVPDVPAAQMSLVQSRPALLVSDLPMSPDDVSAGVLACVRSHYADVPVLIVSDAPGLARESPPGVSFLTRPLDAGKFCSAVNRAIARSVASSSLRGQAGASI